jgi:precorrin-3B synthase
LSRIAEDVGHPSGGIFHRPHVTSVPRQHKSNLAIPGATYREHVIRARDTDACPGALQVHQAADGAMARIRLPGGMITAAQLATLAVISAELGSGTLELTARGNVQVRGITDVTAVAEAIAAAGLLPSATHERVRNIVASPLSGRVGGKTDVRAWVRELDAAIRAEPRLAELGGRFWFSLDDGRGDVSGLGADVGAHVLDDGVGLLLAGRDTGVRVRDVSDVVDSLVGVALRFLDVRETDWRVTELADPTVLLPAAELGAAFPPVTRAPVGWIPQDDGRVTLGAAVPLGVLPARVAEYLAAIEAPLVITPSRSVLVCDLDEEVADVALRVLPPLGLVFDENSPWLSVSACTGSPGCAHSIADVRADAAASLDRTYPVHRHFVGCDRACGSPLTGEVLVATADGYQLLRS